MFVTIFHNFQVVVFWVVTLCNEWPCCPYPHWRWRQQGPLKHWYPTTCPCKCFCYVSLRK